VARRNMILERHVSRQHSMMRHMTSSSRYPPYTNRQSVRVSVPYNDGATKVKSGEVFARSN
jgi:hypothetical protein